MMTPINGRPSGRPAATPCSGRHEHSILIRLLPFYEQAQLFNAFNANVHYDSAPNSTVTVTGLSAIWCPSDPSVSQLWQGDDAYGMRFTSYKGNAGTWFTPGRFQDPTCMGGAFGTLTGQADGIFNFYSRTTIAAITDGTSNTMLMGEYAWGKTSAGRPGVLGLVELGELRGHDVHHALSAQSVQQGPATWGRGQASTPTCLRRPRRASIPAGRTSPSATAR